jgi:hypothetical protein
VIGQTISHYRIVERWEVELIITYSKNQIYFSTLSGGCGGTDDVDRCAVQASQSATVARDITMARIIHPRAAFCGR